jgi:2-octaprenyl-6-methoxyphenol hydroxylase
VTCHRDIVIAGGGMVGVSLALQLGQLMSGQTSICLIENAPLPDPQASGKPKYHPSFDARSTALSYSSRLIYEKMGVWNDLKEWVCPIETIHVSTRGRFGSTVMDPKDLLWPALGYVVENAWLGSALVQALYRQGRVEVVSPARVLKATPGESGTALQIEGGRESQMTTDLLLIADGAQSGLRNQMGVGVQEKSYRQHALIANVATSQPHDGCAFERFTDTGPLALLPLLPGAGAEHRSALVWTLPQQRAERLTGGAEAEVLAALQKEFGYRLGRFTQVGARHSYPLSLIQSSEQVRKGVVVMGNAAHALHPVAGQGFNLALRDVAVLAQELASAEATGLSLGELSVLQAYCDKQRADQARTVAASNSLPALFMHPDPLLGLARDMGLAGLDALPALKREVVRYAAGVAALEDAEHG